MRKNVASEKLVLKRTKKAGASAGQRRVAAARVAGSRSEDYPSDWKAAKTKGGKVYYYNMSTVREEVSAHTWDRTLACGFGV